MKLPKTPLQTFSCYYLNASSSTAASLTAIQSPNVGSHEKPHSCDPVPYMPCTCGTLHTDKGKKALPSLEANTLSWQRGPCIGNFGKGEENSGDHMVSKKHHKHINNPFPSAPKSLPLIHGTLSYNSHLLNHQSFRIGSDFKLLWSSNNGGYISIFHQAQPERSLWSTIPGKAFISAAAAQTKVEESRGSFVVEDGDVSFICNHQFIEEIKTLWEPDMESKGKYLDLLMAENDNAQPLKGTNFPILQIGGWISNNKTKGFASKNLCSWARKTNLRRAGRSSIAVRYVMLLYQKSCHRIEFQVKFIELKQQTSLTSSHKFPEGLQSQRSKQVCLRRRHAACLSSPRDYLALLSENESEEESINVFKEVNRVFITYSSARDEKFYGFGEQFSHMEFKGRRVPILVQEQGIGRGDQPITFAANLVSYRSGGDWSTTYAPSPFYMTTKMRCLYLEGYDYSIFDLTEDDRVQIQIHGNSVRGSILNGTSPTELIEQYTEIIGRPPLLPNWIISGAIIGMQGGTEAVRRVWDQLKDHDISVSAFWLQDWVGQRKTIIGSQLWWNWEVDTTHYAGWRELVDDLKTNNIRVMAYCNPCLVQTHEKPNKNKDLFQEAEKLGILVKDMTGSTYMIPNTAFDVGMLDLTHPETSCWFKRILHEMVDSGVRGWMADFGEGLPLDACLFSGEDQITAHNRYPELWARVNREFVDEWKSECRGKEREDPEESLVFFMRAGFRESPKWAMLFWEGDQMVSWQQNDGIKSSVTGLLSSGLSGFAFNHCDIGGYCAVNLPMINYQRSEELLMRWMELNAFNTVFRTHEGNKPTSNCQFYSNRRTLIQFARCAKLYMAWKFYRVQLVKEASQKGLPIARHLFLHYPDDEHVRNLTYEQFLIGTEILVAPVLDKGKKQVKAYLPLRWGCSWQHIWTGKIFGQFTGDLGNYQQGIEALVDAPIGYPAIFVKLESPVGIQFMNNLQYLKIL
ncbi:Putative alpha-xylosidase 2 [Apostasia shenzhenica]|uniref:Alpha-xylosidase 2 n=1 Tax=Apostasia shenzhenica TaxID=1088818 RepID=A0A2H9ZY09_9ASPA|nr:Putative alpha-xylosidase 2 [Apostasia shenzhenica]